MKLALALAALLTTTAACRGADAPAKAPPADTPAPTAPTPPTGLRLPEGAAPLAYRATLEVDPRLETFRGRAEVDVRIDRAMPILWLDAEELTVRAATVARGEDRVAATVHTHPRHVGLAIPDGFAPGDVTITLDYDGRQTAEQSYGLRRKEDRGDWYIVTQHEAQGARRALPCFDEPRHKVPWTLELTVPDGMRAFGNAKELADEPLPDGRHRVRFAPTKPLPSYLLALAVGPYDVVDAGASRHGAPIRIIVPRGQGADAAFAAAETPKLLAALEDYTGIPYPYDKLDQIVVPGAPRGAMENAGLITYAPKLLVIPPSESAATRRVALEVIAHELAHQWFGNLVTMTWWDDLWLNEAFATWAEAWVLDAVHPELRGDALIAQDRRTALAADGLASARRIRQPVEDEAAIGAAFDGITYQKGATVLHMFEQWLGPEVFRAGVRRYLDRFAWKTATAADLMAALGEAAGRDVAAPMSTFLDQAGAPMVTIARRCEAGQDAVAVLTPGRFLARGARATGAPPRWQLPVCLRVGDEPAPRCTLVSDAPVELALGAGCPRVVAPAGGRGHYLAALDRELWPATARELAALAPAEQVAFVGDLGGRVDAGELDLAALLELAPVWGASRAPHVAELITARLAALAPLVADADRPAFAALVARALGPAARRVGWEARAGEDFVDARLREHVLPLVAATGADPEAAARAVALARAWLDDHAAIPRSLWPVVLYAAMRGGADALFEPALAAVATEPDIAARRALLGALAAVPDAARYRRALDALLAGDAIANERLTLLRVDDPAVEAVAFDLVRDRLPALRAAVAKDWHARLAVTVCDPARRDEVAAWLQAQFAAPEDLGALGVAQAIEEMDQCIATRAALAPQLAAFLGRS